MLTLENGFPQTGSTGFPSYYGIDQNAPTPYVQQWSASIQHELPGSTLFEIAYVGTKGTDLGLFRRFNTPAQVETGENLPPRPGDLQSLRTFPELGTLFQLQHIANSIYHSLQIKAEKRFTGRLSFLASFVWAKSIDDADTQIPGLFESFGAQDERNLRLERGLSFFDVRRRLSAGYVYSFPNAPVLRPVLKNWQLSGNLTFQDGTPLNPVYFATDIRQLGHAESSERRSWAIHPVTGRPAQRRSFLQCSGILDSGALHLRQCGPRYPAGAGQRSGGRRAAPAFPVMETQDNRVSC